MRWDVLKKAWQVAREAFPSAKSLYVSLPPRFSASGEFAAYDMDDGRKLGEMSYEASTRDGKTRIKISINDKSAEAEAVAHGSATIGRVAASRFTPESRTTFEALSRRYADAFALGAAAARLLTSSLRQQAIDVESVRSWAREQGFPPAFVTPLRAGIGRLGFEVVDSDSSYNIRQARSTSRFEVWDRVRIMDQKSMEFGECARVLGVAGDLRDGFWYSVLVDGSEAPIWAPEGLLRRDEAGAVGESIPREVGNAEDDL